MKFNKEITETELNRKVFAFKLQLEKANKKRAEINQPLIEDIEERVKNQTEAYKHDYRLVAERAEEIEIPIRWKDFWFAWIGDSTNYYVDTYETAESVADQYIDTLGNIVRDQADLEVKLSGARTKLMGVISSSERAKLAEMRDKWEDELKKTRDYGELEDFLLFTNAEHLRNYFTYQIAINQAKDLTPRSKTFFGEAYAEVLETLKDNDKCVIGGRDEVFKKITEWTDKVVTPENLMEWDFEGNLVICNIYDGELRLLELV